MNCGAPYTTHVQRCVIHVLQPSIQDARTLPWICRTSPKVSFDGQYNLGSSLSHPCPFATKFYSGYEYSDPARALEIGLRELQTMEVFMTDLKAWDLYLSCRMGLVRFDTVPSTYSALECILYRLLVVRSNANRLSCEPIYSV